MNLSDIPIEKIWLTSDSHYGHKNITYGPSDWSDKETNCRRFDTTEEMSQHMVDQINKYVKEDDLLIHLGDWSFGEIDNIWEFRKQLNVRDIILVTGNHDGHIKQNKIITLYDDIVEEGLEIASDFVQKMPAKQLFQSVYNYLEFEYSKYLFCCMHYPIEDWNDRGNSKIKKSFMLHGHSHGKADIIPNRLDVGLDNVFKLFGEYRPLNLQEIINYLENEDNSNR